MTCSPENLHNLFYTFSTFSFLLLLFLYFSSSLLLKFLNFIGSYPIIQRNQNGYDLLLDEEEEEEEEEEEDRNDTNYFYTAHSEKEYFMADAIQGGGESIEFLARSFSIRRNKKDHVEGFMKPTDVGTVEDTDDSFARDEQLSILASAGNSESDHDEEEMETSDHADPVHDSFANRLGPTSPISMHLRKRVLIDSDRNIGGTTN